MSDVDFEARLAELGGSVGRSVIASVVLLVGAALADIAMLVAWHEGGLVV